MREGAEMVSVAIVVLAGIRRGGVVLEEVGVVDFDAGAIVVVVVVVVVLLVVRLVVIGVMVVAAVVDAVAMVVK